jgi:heme-degrading monooxygenase HmoA
LRFAKGENLISYFNKEAIMSVKIIIERKFNDAPNVEAIRTINNLRINAMRQKGYISGETLVDPQDNRKIVVLSSWSSLEGWEAWLNSPERQQLEAKLVSHLEEPETIRNFLLGSDSLLGAFERIVHDFDVAV